TYQRYLAEQGVDCTLFEVDKLVRLDVGPTGYGLLRREVGLNKRVQGGAATVAVMPEVARDKIVLDPEDIRVDIYRSSGKGGQNINKVETAVRVTHLPTGTVVTCQDERSQLANKKRAMEHLVERLQADRDRLAHAQYVGERDSQVRDRSNAIRVWDEQKGWLRDTRTDVKVSLREASRGQIHRLIVAVATQDKR
ncbi:MAG: peptide chain release factor 1, partial [Clostridia bacterium]|nr:peptide chain release factor 1 [Clostridia bacterium]